MCSSVGSTSPQDQTRIVDPLKLKSKARLRKEVDPEVSGQSQKAIAIDLRTSEPQLSRYLGDQYPDDLPSYKVAHLTRSVGPGYMEWLATQCGGAYHHGEQAPHSHATVYALIGLLAKQGGTVVQQLLQHLEDHIWSEAERQQDVAGLRKMKTLVESLLAEAEGGAK